MTESNAPSTSELELLDVEDLKSGPRVTQSPVPPPPPKLGMKPLPAPMAPRPRPHTPKQEPRALESERPTREDLDRENLAAQSQRPLANEAKALIKHFESELRNEPSPEQTARLHYELGRLFENHLDNPARALQHYQKAHKAASDFLPALRDARRLLISKNDYQSALVLFDAEADLIAQPIQRARLLYHKAVLLEDRLRNVPLAKDVYLQALELAPNDSGVLNGLERCFRQIEAWDELAGIYERRANATTVDPAYRASQLFLRGKLAEHKQGNLESAIEFYQSALQSDPNHYGAIATLKRLHHTHHRWHELCEILHHEAERTTDSKLQVTNWLQIAHVSLERLKDQQRALLALKMAASASGDDAVILHRLAVLYEQAGCIEEAIAVWGQWIATEADSSEAVHVAHRVGALAEHRVGNEDLAVQWYERAMHLRADYDPARLALDNLYNKRSDWDALVGINLQFAQVSDSPTARAHAHARVAEVLETRLDEPNEAIDQHLRALSFIPNYDASLKALDRLYRATGKFIELVQLNERLLDTAPDNPRKIAILFEIGSLCEVNVKDHQRAAQAYKRILTLEPHNLNAIHSLQRASEDFKDYKTLVEALDLEAKIIGNNHSVVELQHRAAEIYAIHLKEPAEAIRRLRLVLEIEPHYAPALHSLRKLYYDASRWADVLDTYQRELDAATNDGTRAELHYQIGRIYQDAVGKTREASDNYQRALRLDPLHEASAQALEELSRTHGQWSQLSEVLALKLKHHSDETEKAFAALEIGELYEEQLKDKRKAAEAYIEALKHKPSLQTANAALIRLRHEEGQWRELAKDLQQQAQTTDDPRLAVEGLIQEGDLWSERLQDPAKAIACFEAVLQQEPHHLGALASLEQLLMHTSAKERLQKLYPQWVNALQDPKLQVAQWRELARAFSSNQGQRTNSDLLRHAATEILKSFAEDEEALLLLEHIALEANDVNLLIEIEGLLSRIAVNPTLASMHLLRLAEALESSNHPDAVNVYRAAAKKDPRNLGAVHGFCRLAEASTEPGFTVEAKRMLAAASLDPEQAAGYLTDSARLLIEQLENPVEALNDLRQALQLWPEHARAVDHLERLLSGAGQHRQLAEILSEVAASITSPREGASLWLRVAQLHSRRENDIAAAIHALTKALKVAPDHLEVILELATIFTQDRQWKPASDMLGRAISLARDPAVLLQCHVQLAELSLEHIADPDTAKKHLEAALQIDPNHHRALAQLAELQLAAGSTTQALSTAGRLARLAQSPEEKSVALGCLGKLHLMTGDKTKALECYRQAISLGGPQEHLLVVFKELVQEINRWDILIEALEAYVKEASTEPPYVVVAYRELAWIHHHKFERIDVAIDTLRMGIARTHGNIILRRTLVQRLKEAGHFSEAVHELNHVVHTDVTLNEVWRDLAALYAASNRPMEARLAIQPLLVLGTAASSDIAVAQSMPLRSAEGQPGSLTLERLTAVAEMPAHSRAATQLLRSIRTGVGKLFPPDFDGYGTWEKQSLRTERPLVTLTRKIADILGLQDFELYIHTARGRGVGIELAETPIVLVPADLEEHTLSKQTFLIAHALVKIALQLEATAKLMPRELQILLAAASRGVAPDFGSGLTSDDIMDEQSKRLYRALSRKARKSMEEAAALYVSGQPVDFLAWVSATEQAACRVAALISDDLPGSIDIWRRSKRELATLQGVALVQHSPEVRDFMSFWCSDNAMQLRRSMGLI